MLIRNLWRFKYIFIISILFFIGCFSLFYSSKKVGIIVANNNNYIEKESCVEYKVEFLNDVLKKEETELFSEKVNTIIVQDEKTYMYFGEKSSIKPKLYNENNEKQSYIPNMYVGDVDYGKKRLNNQTVRIEDEIYNVSGVIVSTNLDQLGAVKNIILYSSRLDEGKINFKSGDSLKIVTKDLHDVWYELQNNNDIKLSKNKEVDKYFPYDIGITIRYSNFKLISIILIIIYFLLMFVFMVFEFRKWREEELILSYLGYSSKMQQIKNISIFIILVVAIIIANYVINEIVLSVISSKFDGFSKTEFVNFSKESQLYYVYVVLVSLTLNFIYKQFTLVKTFS